MLMKTVPVLSKNVATIIGLLAIFLWSSNVGLVRSVSLNFGAVGGAALIYSIASLFLWMTVGWPKFKQIPKNYLLWGSVLFVAYELCFALSIGYAHHAQQAIEVGMINYLWPTFTLLFAMLFNQMKANFLIVPGSLLALLGIAWILGGDQGINIMQIWGNLQDNPISYGLAFLGALIWAAYCSLTVKKSQGHNAVTFFFVLVSVVLWMKYFWLGGGTLNFNYVNTAILIFAAAALGFGYATWNIGIMHGHLSFLAGASYFTPVLSAVLAAMLLHTSLSIAFWQGTAMVCLGAILCWISTKK